MFSLGELYKQKLFKDKIGTIFQTSDNKSNKWYLCCGVGFSCSFPSLPNQVLRERERNTEERINNLSVPVPKHS